MFKLFPHNLLLLSGYVGLIPAPWQLSTELLGWYYLVGFRFASRVIGFFLETALLLT